MEKEDWTYYSASNLFYIVQSDRIRNKGTEKRWIFSSVKGSINCFKSYWVLPIGRITLSLLEENSISKGARAYGIKVSPNLGFYELTNELSRSGDDMVRLLGIIYWKHGQDF